MRARGRSDFLATTSSRRVVWTQGQHTTCSTQPCVALVLSHKISFLPEPYCIYGDMHLVYGHITWLWLRSYTRNHQCVFLKIFPSNLELWPFFFSRITPLLHYPDGEYHIWDTIWDTFSFFPSQRINIKKWSISFQMYFFLPFIMIFFKFMEAINKHQRDSTTSVAL